MRDRDNAPSKRNGYATLGIARVQLLATAIVCCT